jgi:hypothetical protein
VEMRRYIIREREREEGGRKWGSSDVQRRGRIYQRIKYKRKRGTNLSGDELIGEEREMAREGEKERGTCY